MSTQTSIAASEMDEPSEFTNPEVERFENIVIGFVGYLGAGCTHVADSLETEFKKFGYEVHRIKVSRLILDHFGESITRSEEEAEGAFKLRRTIKLQALGDKLRDDCRSNSATVGLVLQKIYSIREFVEDSYRKKIVFLVDSLKHPDEVNTLRSLYGRSFRLVSVFADRESREHRLMHRLTGKFQKADPVEVSTALNRDEDDKSKDHGQKVRKTFFLGDFFINNNHSQSDETDNFVFDSALTRFTQLLVGEELHRPYAEEAAMYHAFGAAMKSACLSRQVGAVLTTSEGEIIATGINEVPKFGGGVYDNSSMTDDCRCFAWEYDNGNLKFKGCHKDRKNKDLRDQIAGWIKTEFLKSPLSKIDAKSRKLLIGHLDTCADDISGMPGVGDIIEYSRSIHAEMDALLSAARNGISTKGRKLYCTTYPCHNCARHLVSAGVLEVQYIEPYVKSQAIDLHGDSITDAGPITVGSTPDSDTVESKKMVVRAFSGVGPRMFEDHFLKRGELKLPGGQFDPPTHRTLVSAAALNSIEESEEKFRNHILPK